MNWKSFITPIIAIVVLVILSEYGILGIFVGIILAILLFMLPSLLSALFPILIDYALKPRVALQIKDIRLIKKNSNNVEGHQLKALITNNGKRICLKLEATTIQVKDDQGRSPNLLHIDVDDTGAQTKVSSREEPAREVGYAWIDEKGHTILGVLEELRKKDEVNLLYPYETTFIGRVENLNRLSSSSSECLLRLMTNAKYNVILELKGEGYEKTTVMKTRKRRNIIAE